MRHKTNQAAVELGFAGLALLRSFPSGDPTNLLKEMLEKLKQKDWADFEIEEFDTEAGYTLWAETYDALPNPLVDLEEPIVRSMIDRLTPGVAIDAACGTARHSAYLLERGHSVVAIDSSESMLAKARKRVPGADIRSGSLLELPVSDGVADLAVCALALTHFAELDLPIVELARVVQQGGRAILSDIHPIAVATGAHAFFKSAGGSRGMVKNHIHWPSQYLKAFRGAGLAVVDCAEPQIDKATVEKINPSSTTKHWMEQALLGLPFALIWEVERV